MTPHPARMPPRFSTWTWIDCPGAANSVKVMCGTGLMLASQRVGPRVWRGRYGESDFRGRLLLGCRASFQPGAWGDRGRLGLRRWNPGPPDLRAGVLGTHGSRGGR